MTATALYDYAARMVSWTAGTGTGQRAVSYRYDALGRLLRRQEQSGVQTVEVTDFAYAGWQLAEERRAPGGGAIVREVLEISASCGGRKGVYQFIKNPDGIINHRMFVPTRP